MPNTYLLLGLQLAPLSMQRIVKAVPESRWDDRTHPKRFSFRESVAHLADWEPILLERMQAAIVYPGATIREYDEMTRGIEQGYGKSCPVEQVQTLIDRREVTVRYLREKADGNWNNFVVHPDRGPLSLNDQANLILGHDHYHLEHLTQYL